MRWSLILLLFLIGSCVEQAKEESLVTGEEQIEFNESDWKIEEDGSYPKRRSMVDDILYTDRIRKLQKESVLALLGEANKVVDEFYYYTIWQESIGMWTIRSKTLVVKFTDTGEVEWIKLHG